MFSGVARSPKYYAHQWETTRSSKDSPQLRTAAMGTSLKGKIRSQRERNLSFKSSLLWYGKSLKPHTMTSLECYYFY